MPRRVWRRVATSLIANRFTKALFEPARALNLETAWSFAKAARVFLKGAMFVVVDGFVNEALIRCCLCAGVNAVSRNRALEAAGCRKRAFEKLRCGPACPRPLRLRYAPYVDFLCWPFLCAGLYGICAPVVSVVATIPMEIKNPRFMTSPILFDFVTSNTGHRCE